ncbi:MAG: hypothetical protein F2667_04420 [Actinobacteria bacterium]|nr:hypothetical protein [Actinomycetota bacterium]
MSSVDLYPVQRRLDAAEVIVAAIEGAVGTSFVARRHTETHDGTGAETLLLRRPDVLGLVSVTVNGSVVDMTSLAVLPGGVLRWPTGGLWNPGRGNVRVTYTAGHTPTPPADVREAALLGTREHLLATSSNAEIAERQKALVKEAKAADPDSTGYVDVDACIRRWRPRVELIGFA